jgi:hypothetical protein
MSDESRRLERAETSDRWTVGALHDYFERRFSDLEKRIDERFSGVEGRFSEIDTRFGQFAEERDRRYTEVNIEKEKALKIKETADLTALSLAREIQTYKDEKANELRSQIERERGTYATHDELSASVEKLETLVEPIAEYVHIARGRSTGASATVAWMFAGGGIAIALGSLIINFAR